MNNDGWIDKLLAKFGSRKLFVFLVACVGLFTSHLNSGDWVFIALIYIAAQGTVDAIDIWKAKNNNQNNSNHWKH